MRHELFQQVGGFPDLPLMEDIAMSRTLKRHGRPACLRERVTTSARRWERHGVWRTILLMWRLRAAYFLGADPRQLAIRYGYSPVDRHDAVATGSGGGAGQGADPGAGQDTTDAGHRTRRAPHGCSAS